MSSIQEQIQVRMLAVLIDATDAGANVFRSRETFLARESTQAIGIFPGAEVDTVHSSGADEHEFSVTIEVFGRGDPWYSVADPVATAVHRLLMTDAGLQALTTRIRRHSRTPREEDPDKTAGVYEMEYGIRYLTKASDIADANIY